MVSTGPDSTDPTAPPPTPVVASGDAAPAVEDATSVGRLGRDAVIYGLGFVLSRAAGFIMLPIYTRYLVASDYGTLHLLTMSVDVASILLSSGLTAGVFRFTFKTEDDRERRAVVVAAWWMTFVFNGVGALALLGAAPWIAEVVLENPDYADLVRIVAFNFLLEPCFFVPALLMQVRQRAALYTLASSLRLAIQLGLNILFVVYLEQGVRGIVVGTLIMYLVTTPIMMWWMFRQTGFPLSRKAAWDLVRFGLPYRVTEAGTFTLTYVDRYFLVAAAGLAATGVYSLAYQFGFVLVYLGTHPFMLAWDPQRFQLVTAPREERDRAYNAGFLFLTCLVVTLAVGISLFVTPTLTLMSDPEYHAAAPLVPIILAAYVMQAWSRALEFNIQVSEKTLFTTAGTWIAVAVVVVLYILLIPWLGPLGAALATVIAFAVRVVVFAVFGHYLWPVSYRWFPHLLLVFYGVAAVVPYFLYDPHGFYEEFAIATMLFSAYALLAWRGGVLRPADRAAILAEVRRRWSQLRGALASQGGEP